MQENEVIIVDGIGPKEFDELIDACIRYAIISKPFTIRRVGGLSLKHAIANIFKGKLAEALFRCFCEKNDIFLDWKTPSTPFWMTDKRDFIYQHTEWDIKNNYIYHSHDILQPYPYTQLPALIPNRRQGDQWDKRNEIKNHKISHSTGYIFTFIKGATVADGNRTSDFFSFEITEEQLSLLERAEKKYAGYPAKEKPFDEKRFWNEMEKRGDLNYIKIHHRPYLIITAYATNDHWQCFKNTGPMDLKNSYQTSVDPFWYRKNLKGTINFLNGTIRTTITNATAPIKDLPSFASLFPKLKSTIRNGRFKV
jgi:hypothetical protein